MITYLIISFLLTLFGILPWFNIAHWTFRVFDFIRLQLLFLQVVTLVFGLFYFNTYYFIVWSAFLIILLGIIYQIRIIAPYLSNRNSKEEETQKIEESISLISINVLQKNNDYGRLIDLVNNNNPDILLTMETNKAWEKAMETFENKYSFCHKIPKENRYGLHFYTSLEVISCKTHYLISEETPSLEVCLKDKKGKLFNFWGVHPPPPSPTEKPTAKQKDAELMKIAKLIRKSDLPSLVTGDFNNVCWSKTAKLFAKTSLLQDARLGRGIYGTFPAQLPLLKFPLDLIFNSKYISVNKIDVLENIGSDHLPLFATFCIEKSKSQTKSLTSEADSKINDIIEEGKVTAKEENDL